ncbi:MAG: hypothetical protein DLM55_05785 [Acidimicrobiales bacterium]|nr:MAG: hypothetical protein DLM55_05785 [Acidimicrobiales bacterium]
MNETTTIRVRLDTRDRLAGLAAEQGRTMAEYLDEVASVQRTEAERRKLQADTLAYLRESLGIDTESQRWVEAGARAEHKWADLSGSA